MIKKCYFCSNCATKELKVNKNKFIICQTCFDEINIKYCNLCGGIFHSFNILERCLVCMKYRYDFPIR